MERTLPGGAEAGCISPPSSFREALMCVSVLTSTVALGVASAMPISGAGATIGVILGFAGAGVRQGVCS